MEFPSPADSGPERYITSFAHRREVLRLQLTACPRLKQSSKVGMLSRIVEGHQREGAPNFELYRGGSRNGHFSGRYPEG